MMGQINKCKLQTEIWEDTFGKDQSNKPKPLKPTSLAFLTERYQLWVNFFTINKY